MKRFLPLIFVELYLVFTLIVLFFGPLSYNLHNIFLFFVLISFYHVSFILGYVVSDGFYSFKNKFIQNKFSNAQYYTILIFAVLACLITYKNVMLGDSLIPWDLFKQVQRGITSPAEVYMERLDVINSGTYSTSRIMNVLSVLFMFAKFLFIFYCIFWWRSLSFLKRAFFILFCFLFLMPSIAGGINSILFYFFIFSSVSLFFVKIIRGELQLSKFSILLLLGLAIPIGFFGYIMSLRGGGFEFFNNLSPLGDISTSASTPKLDNILGFYYYSFVWLSSYLVQGYYGFSLALGEEWIWTYGFGSSHFLQNQLLAIFGIDISTWTFQARISDVWDEKAMWHSFYAQMANDVGFIGVGFVMFLFGFLLSRIWCTIIYEKSFFGSAMMPILVIFFIFLPANNQVFGFIDTISYFFAVLFLWLFEEKRLKV